eukprot:CAMPEP_0182545432 /NCGR_PEP_ID=MMETSP1323-20130603/34548_1 /TAXON_ID=236787 /ORGANISM="Florenciella parvula, Strain RCC1693" /LENGTH=175 /DNA_ID=CAMNT_0024756585 /DNA_START=113 /DNA_END=641 /DNA_ORIENTATION=+
MRQMPGVHARTHAPAQPRACVHKRPAGGSRTHAHASGRPLPSAQASTLAKPLSEALAVAQSVALVLVDPQGTVRRGHPRHPIRAVARTPLAAPAALALSRHALIIGQIAAEPPRESIHDPGERQPHHNGKQDDSQVVPLLHAPVVDRRGVVVVALAGAGCTVWCQPVLQRPDDDR